MLPPRRRPRKEDDPGGTRRASTARYASVGFALTSRATGTYARPSPAARAAPDDARLHAATAPPAAARRPQAVVVAGRSTAAARASTGAGARYGPAGTSARGTRSAHAAAHTTSPCNHIRPADENSPFFGARVRRFGEP